MPPVVSDDDSVSGDVPDSIPARLKKNDPQADEEDDDEEDEEDEFQVEKILDHKTTRGKIQYKVKWLGWENDADTTWEPLDNLDNAMEAVEAYHISIGGTPVPTGKGKGKRGPTTSNADSPAPKKGRSRKSDTNGTSEKQELPLGLWEDMCSVAAIIEEHEMPDASSTKKQKDNKSLVGMLQWNDGRKTQHPMTILRTKCPQRVLDYYENHLVFKGDPRYVDDNDE